MREFKKCLEVAAIRLYSSLPSGVPKPIVRFPPVGCGKRMQQLRVVRIASFVAIAVLCVSLSSVAQQDLPSADSSQATTEYLSIPWTDGTVEDALQFSAAGKTIPLTHYSITAKDGNTYKGVLVGGDPFKGGPRPVTLHAVVVPLVIQIVDKGQSALFDPTKPDPCDGGISALIRFIASPMVNPYDLTFNGVDVGYYQYIDGYMRAEFWNEISKFHNGSGYSNPIVWSYAPKFILPAFIGSTNGLINGNGCAEYGAVSHPLLDEFIRYIAIPILQAEGVIAPNQLAMFLLHNVVSQDTVGSTKCCTKGYHSAVGNPAQTYAVVDFNTSTNSKFKPVHDITTSSHEVAEWMNDPLGTNATPLWGNIGQVSGCDSTLEVGDPLEGTVLNFSGFGSTYHPQELAFFSWFFNAKTTASLGAGGFFSSNKTFATPAKKCSGGGS